MERIFLTFFYVGYLRPAPGTWGSLAGALIAAILLRIYGEAAQNTLVLLSVLLFFISIGVINSYEKKTGEHDSSFIVIDEVVGVWIAMAFGGGYFINMVLAFVFFRLFDIYKPSIIGRIDKEVKGGLGVMLDDVVAGVFAGILTLIVQKIVYQIGFESLWF
ncbi:phosphatidylglycerophosphatase A [uncultured Campylobacter sp.]|uniref:phosphatidylglycerophosphatase A family protein n=1 Tax=uncultured Campylobacter sp. TaxID=218934 RepID=UPI002632BF77|nr:phosphatidylglycerophosphatase A [uncultured Campylobacter sp.]